MSESPKLMRAYLDLMNESLGETGVSNLANEILTGLKKLQAMQQNVPQLKHVGVESGRISFERGDILDDQGPTIDGFANVISKTQALKAGNLDVKTYTQEMTEAFKVDAYYMDRYEKDIKSKKRVEIYKDGNGVDYVAFNDGILTDPYLGPDIQLEFFNAYKEFLKTLKTNLEHMRRMANLER